MPPRTDPAATKALNPAMGRSVICCADGPDAGCTSTAFVNDTLARQTIGLARRRKAFHRGGLAPAIGPYETKRRAACLAGMMAVPVLHMPHPNAARFADALRPQLTQRFSTARSAHDVFGMKHHRAARYMNILRKRRPLARGCTVYTRLIRARVIRTATGLTVVHRIYDRTSQS